MVRRYRSGQSAGCGHIPISDSTCMPDALRFNAGVLLVSVTRPCHPGITADGICGIRLGCGLSTIPGMMLQGDLASFWPKPKISPNNC
jgi:hypothetical protein